MRRRPTGKNRPDDPPAAARRGEGRAWGLHGRVVGVAGLAARQDHALSAGLEVRDVPGKGRGLVAGRRFAKDSVIESTPVIVIPSDEWSVIETGVLGAYCFWWDEEAGDRAFAVGWTSFLNHSYTPNVFAQTQIEELRIEFRTLRAIDKGEELTINYNGEAHDRSPLGFDVVDD